jgi:hypothetical protein
MLRGLHLRQQLAIGGQVVQAKRKHLNLGPSPTAQCYRWTRFSQSVQLNLHKSGAIPQDPRVVLVKVRGQHARIATALPDELLQIGQLFHDDSWNGSVHYTPTLRLQTLSSNCLYTLIPESDGRLDFIYPIRSFLINLFAKQRNAAAQN